MCNYVLKCFIKCFIKPCMFELIAANVLLRFEKLDSRSRSVFPLIFEFPLYVLCSYKALINSTCNSGLYRIYKHSYFLFFQLIAYHWSFVSYQNICIFIKRVKYHAERSKNQFHPGWKFSVFSLRWKARVSQKKFTQVEISSRGEFHLAYV